MIDKKMYRLAGMDNATCFIALGNNGRRFLKRAAIMSPTNSGNYQYTKFTTYATLNTNAYVRWRHIKEFGIA